jgi:hypothetical protein
VSNREQCEGTRQDGRRCGGPALSDSLYFFAQGPKRAAAREAAQRKGGHNRASIVRLRALVPPRLIDVYDQLETALSEVHEGTLKPGPALAMAALARAMVAVLQAGELEERVRELEGRRQA